jgi:hypothetical protein
MATTDHSHSPGHGSSNHGIVLNHEPTDVSLKGITRIAILSFAIIIVILGLVYGIWRGFESWAADSRTPAPLAAYKPGEVRMPSGPLLQTDEPGGLRQFRAEERKILDHYAWVDKNQGVVRVPVARAMELLAEHPDRIAPMGPTMVSSPAPAAEAAAPAAAAPARH